jgi:hypothetical protein
MAQTTPFGFIYSTIIKFPGFVAFRSTFTKLGPLIIALVACLLAFRSAFSKKFSMIITFSLGIYLVFMSLIPLTGTTIRDFLYQKDITAITTLNHAVAQGESAIVLPFPTYGIYRFRTNDGKEMWIPPEIFNNALPDRKILSLGYGNSSYSDNFLQKIQKTDQNGVYVGDSFWGDINLLGINKIVIDKTYYDPFNKNYNYQNIENALIEKGLPKVYESNQFTVYKNIGEIKPLIAGADITNINTISPTEYQIEIPKDKGQKLEFQQTYGAWKLYETSDKLPILGFLFSKEITNNHKFDNKFANSWIIGNTDLNRSNDKDVKITIYYKPQDYINLGFFISFLSLVGLILYLNIFRTKTNRDC